MACIHFFNLPTSALPQPQSFSRYLPSTSPVTGNRLRIPYMHIIYFDQIHPSFISLQYPPFSTTTFLFQFHVLFFFFLSLNTLSTTCICMGRTIRSMGHFLGPASLKNTDFPPSSCHFPRYGWGFMSSSPIHARIPAGLILCWSCACGHDHCELMCATVMSCLANTLAADSDSLLLLKLLCSLFQDEP